ncbi:MAG: hypothetical protein GY795_34660 [Desulfobacterales bacterium]|nr:hypothetical protein [Desulfobacterales bacterium]
MKNSRKNRRDFYLKTLCDARQEFHALEDTSKILDAFLLTAMGALGITRGFVFLVDRETLKGQATARGLENSYTEKLLENIPEIIKYYFPEAPWKNAPLPADSYLITKQGIADAPFCPPGTKILVKWYISKKYLGLTGLGVNLLSNDFYDEDIEFLFSLLNNLIFSINNTRYFSVISRLSQDLQENNNKLEKSLKQVEQSKNSLNQRLFHLKSFYDMFLELSSLKDIKKIMETFLLMIIGIFSVRHACIFLFDREDMTVQTACRGTEKNKIRTLSQDDLDKIIMQFFDAADFHRLAPMNVRILTDKRLPDIALCPVAMNTGLIFAINQNCIGIICFGDKITGQGYSRAEHELLLTLANNFMVFLDNARSFEMIKKLNTGLEERNIELNKTIEDLTQTRRKIEVLEKAGNRIRSVLQKEMAKMGQVTITDLVLILTLGLLLGLAYNYSSPGGVEIIPSILLRKPGARIDASNAKLKHEAEAVIIIDARPSEFFRQKHIKKAVNLPPALFDFVYMMRFSSLDPQKELIVYGRNISRHYDEEVAFKLVTRGHKNVKVLTGGLSAWEKAGYPIEK